MNKSILIVEDDHEVRVELRRLFEEVGYFVGTVTNGARALEYLATVTTPGAILLDMNMPLMDGEQFLLILKANPALGMIPVIQMSAARLPKHALAQAAIDKPFDSHALLALVERLWPSSPPAQKESA